MATGGQILDNRRGMAPPLAVELESPRPVALRPPGVPREFEAVLEEVLIPDYFSGSRALTVVESRHPGAVEADFAEPMRLLELEFPDVAVGSYPRSGSRPDHPLRGEDPERVRAPSSGSAS